MRTMSSKTMMAQIPTCPQIGESLLRGNEITKAKSTDQQQVAVIKEKLSLEKEMLSDNKTNG